jgi:hypothetical protein
MMVARSVVVTVVILPLFTLSPRFTIATTFVAPGAMMEYFDFRGVHVTSASMRSPNSPLGVISMEY